MSKTALARSRPRRSPFAANDNLRFRRYSLPLHRLQGSPLKARDSGPRRRGEIPCQPRRQLGGRLARSRFFYKRRFPASTERPEVPLNEAKNTKQLSFFVNNHYFYSGRRIALFLGEYMIVQFTKTYHYEQVF